MCVHATCRRSWQGSLQRDYTDAQLREMRASYWGAAGEAMELVDRVLEAAHRTGHLNNTVVFYT